ncbi:MAG: VTT domain-containing protein [Dehalococcoidia bacterium]|nr:VTT domain-containing protein [Dehalococcoidia bacterium]
MIDDFLSNLPNMHPLTPKRGEKWRWWHLAILIAILIGLSVGIYFLLRFTEGFLKERLADFAIYAYIIVFFVSALSAATIFLPAPGIIVVLVAASKWNPTWVALWASVGSTLGELTAYYAGYWGSKIVVKKETRTYIKFEQWMKRYGMFTVMVFAAIPFMPFHIGGIAAGAFRLPLWQYLIAMFVGKAAKNFGEIFGWAGILNLIRHFAGD